MRQQEVALWERLGGQLGEYENITRSVLLVSPVVDPSAIVVTALPMLTVG